MAAEDEALTKTGKELFRELLRYYPVAEFEDYLKNGVWKDDQMRIDLQLYLAHRNEAGANEPSALEEVKLPDIPDVKPVTGPKLGVPGLLGARPTLVPTPGLTGAAGDLREIALFVSKYKLDPSKAKTVLAPLLPARRKYVMTNFKCESTGADATAELEKYIKDTAVSVAVAGTSPGAAPGAVVGAKLAVTSPAKAATAVGAVRPGVTVSPLRPVATVAPRPGVATVAPPGGVKRPIMAPQMVDASKRPRITIGQQAPAAARPAISMVRPPGLAVGGRPVVAPPAGRGLVVGAPGAVRPPGAQWPRAVTPQKW